MNTHSLLDAALQNFEASSPISNGEELVEWSNATIDLFTIDMALAYIEAQRQKDTPTLRRDLAKYFNARRVVYVTRGFIRISQSSEYSLTNSRWITDWELVEFMQYQQRREKRSFFRSLLSLGRWGK